MSNMAIRWSGENDRYFGPFTYARERRGYRSLAVVLGSGDGDDYPGCRLRLSAFGHTLIIALPPIIRPHATRHYPKWDAATVARLGRDWYDDFSEREYGFTYGEGFLNVKFGRQTHDSSTEKNFGWFPPWTQWRFVRHSLYGLDGSLFADLPHRARYGSPEYAESRRLEESCPTATFAFKDFDGEELTVTTKIEEREWLFGERGFAWLSLFRKPKVRRSLDLRFSDETGRRKGSWKGGTIGSGITLEPGQLHESGFRHYCADNGMAFIGPVDPTQ